MATGSVSRPGLLRNGEGAPLCASEIINKTIRSLTGLLAAPQPAWN
jgi:hypothetical protein